MSWITSILGLVGGGWGTFAAVIALGIFGFILYKMYKKSIQDEANKDTKEKAVEDQINEYKKNDKLEKDLEGLEKESKETQNKPNS